MPFKLHWDEDKTRAEAKKYDSLSAFNAGSRSAYVAALKRYPHILREVFVRKIRQWDEASLRKLASSFKYKKEFWRAERSAYVTCQLRYPHLLNEVFANNGRMPGTSSDNDAIYIWRVVGEYFNGNPVYKIGVTSARLGTKRIDQVATKAGFDYELICCEPVRCPADQLEKKLLLLGENPGYIAIEGYTEFRALSDSALYAAVSMICGAM